MHADPTKAKRHEGDDGQTALCCKSFVRSIEGLAHSVSGLAYGLWAELSKTLGASPDFARGSFDQFAVAAEAHLGLPALSNPYEVVMETCLPRGTLKVSVGPNGELDSTTQLREPVLAERLRLHGLATELSGFGHISTRPQFTGGRLRELLLDPDRVGPSTPLRRVRDEMRKIAREEVFPAALASLLGLVGQPVSRGGKEGDLLVRTAPGNPEKVELSGLSIKAFRADSKIFLPEDPRGRRDFQKSLEFLCGANAGSVDSHCPNTRRQLLIVQNGASDAQLLELQQRFAAGGASAQQVLLLLAPVWRAAGLRISGDSTARSGQAIVLEIDVPKLFRFFWLRELVESGRLVLALNVARDQVERAGLWESNHSCVRVANWDLAALSYVLGRDLLPIAQYLESGDLGYLSRSSPRVQDSVLGQWLKANARDSAMPKLGELGLLIPDEVRILPTSGALADSFFAEVPIRVQHRVSLSSGRKV